MVSEVFTNCGVLDTATKTAVIYAANHKFKLNGIEKKQGELELIGIVTGTRDCIVTETRVLGEPVEVDGAIKGIGVKNNNVSTFTICKNAHESVTRPSECIESAMKNTTSAFKYAYSFSTLFEPDLLHDPINRAKKMDAIARMSTVPVSTVGVKMRVSDTRGGIEKDVVVHNPSGVAGFNPFNSSPVYFEAHGEMDVLMMMASFLKYNSLWGEITANMDLNKFDYAGAFFDGRWHKRDDCDETSFIAARSQLLTSYFKCKSAIKSMADKQQKRKHGHRAVDTDDEIEISTGDLRRESITGCAAMINGHAKKCPHDPAEHHINLCGDERAYCIACFATIFFVPLDVCNGFVEVRDRAGLRNWIEQQMALGAITLEKSGTSEEDVKELLLRLADITQAAHGGAGGINNNDVALGPCGRRWNWPPQIAASLQEFVFYGVASALKEVRRHSLPQMDTGMLYRLMSPFGKMLLLFINNTSIMTNKRDANTPSPGGYAEGKWWDVRYAGPNLWTFQITKCYAERRKMGELACLETLQRLPLPGEEYVDSRFIFKGFCRGECLSGAGEVVSDITQSVNTANLLLGNRQFRVDEDTKSINTTPGVGDVVCSLEVTGFRPNRAQETRNSSRVSARIMRILETREGALAWRMPRYNALVLERINHDVTASTEAMERALSLHKVLYYDIETTTVNMADESAVITSICCCLCIAGDMKWGGERSVFGLAAPGSDPASVEAAIERLYPEKRNEKPREDVEKEEYVVTDHPPDLVKIYTNEFDLLMGFAEYVQATRPMVVSGWNSRSFDDAFVFTRIVKHVSTNSRLATVDTVKSVLPGAAYTTTAEQRIALAATGLFDLSQFMNPITGFLDSSVASDLLAGASSLAEAKYQEQKKMVSSSRPGSVGWFQSMIGGCCTAIRLDLMQVCAKAYKESLSEFNLNAVLAKVSNVADRLRNVKDVVDLHYHLLRFLKLENCQDQAIVHVYCCKDAYLTAVVASATSKESEIFRLCMDSGLTEAVVTANLVTPLCIGEGAVCRNMGAARADRRGVGVRRHSIATDTKGGMVSQPIVNFVPYQTIDMTSLYPMAMIHNNLCVSTFVTQQQIIDLRDRLVEIEVAKGDGAVSLLAIIDECNFKVLDYYRPNDIAVPSWRNSNTNKRSPITRLEKRIGKRFVDEDATCDGWSKNSPPNMAVKAAGLDYFPEVLCDINIQQAAKVNDDMHIAPSSLEYMLVVLPVLALGYPHIAGQITAGECQDAAQLLDVLDEEFNAEKDEMILKTHWTFAGDEHHDFSTSPVSDRARNIIKRTGRWSGIHQECERLITLLDRIYRRVSVYDSADDHGVRLWSSRLINVGMLVRTWTIKHTSLRGVIPSMQKKYRADRVVMQQNVKKYRETDPKRAGLNSVGERTAKLAMNSMYGCLALKAKTSKLEFRSGTASNANDIANASHRGGIGGGTRHSTTANQITETARCVFGNIGCALQQALPGTKQAYGDTDSVFCVHNIPGDGGQITKSGAGGRLVYPMDILLKCKLAALVPLLVNTLTKGIRHVARRDAGEGVMNIAHERLAVLGLLFAKKTYHMLHFNENSACFAAMQNLCKKACAGKTVTAEDTASIDKFVTLTNRPSYADGYTVPHNPGLILRAASSTGGEKLENFLTNEGVTDEATLSKWLSSSPVWIELDARTLNNLYASKIVEAENGYWIDEITSRPLPKGAEHDAVTQANAAFTSYKKGAFAKKGIPTSIKLKGLQSAFSRQLPLEMDPEAKYMEVVKHHVNNYASHTTDPCMMITSARVNKLDTHVTQNRPNPLAVTINNHLNPNQEINLGDKFKSVASVSAWSIVADGGDIPAGYFNMGGVRWNPENMKGSLSCFTIKNLSVVPNAVTTAYDMMHNDKTAITSMVKKNADVLSSAAAFSGFSLRKGALSFNTGVVIANDLAMACIKTAENINTAFVGTQHNVDFEDGDVSFDEGEQRRQRVWEERAQREDAVASFLCDMKKNIDEGILARILNSTCSTCPGALERERAVNLAAGKNLSKYITDVMELDPRVAVQMDALVKQLDIIREVCNKKRTPGGAYKSLLDVMVSNVEINMADVFKIAADKTNLHWSRCPVTVPDGKGIGDDAQIFKVALQAMAGLHKCTNTCDIACCQSLYFVLLSSLALNLENERRASGVATSNFSKLLAQRVFEGDERMAEIAVARIMRARELDIVKTCFPTTYNRDTDTVILLFEPFRMPNHPTASMTLEDIKMTVSSLSETKTIGKIWNCSDQRFFGAIKDRESMDEDAALYGVEHQLPFHTGMYHRPALEIAAACLSVYL